MTPLAETYHRFKEVLSEIRDTFRKNNLEMENKLDPENLIKTDPNDTIGELLAEAKDVYDPIDTPNEIEEYLENNRSGPGM